MALILNKSITGITSSTTVTGTTNNYIETGYTETIYTESAYTETVYDIGYNYIKTTNIIGLNNLLYIDEYGNSHENPYLVIDAIVINKLSKLIKIYVSIYKDLNSRIELKKPLFENHYNISNQNLYDTYFSINNMLNINIFEKSYEYIKTIHKNWKSDE